MGNGSFTLISDDIADGQPKPLRHAHQRAGGENLAPHLAWTGFPEQTASFAVTCFDPDSAGGGWWHWLVVDLPPSTTSLPQGGSLPPGAVATRNSSGTRGYSGAAPPPGGPHRYVFTVYALDVPSLGVTEQAPPDDVAGRLATHTLASASIATVFQR